MTMNVVTPAPISVARSVPRSANRKYDAIPFSFNGAGRDSTRDVLATCREPSSPLPAPGLAARSHHSRIASPATLLGGRCIATAPSARVGSVLRRAVRGRRSRRPRTSSGRRSILGCGSLTSGVLVRETLELHLDEPACIELELLRRPRRALLPGRARRELQDDLLVSLDQ